MRHALLAGLIAAIPVMAVADDTGDALTKFGIVGTFSSDCSNDAAVRVTFTVTAADGATMVASRTLPKMMMQSTVRSAKIIETDKISLELAPKEDPAKHLSQIIQKGPEGIRMFRMVTSRGDVCGFR